MQRSLESQVLDNVGKCSETNKESLHSKELVMTTEEKLVVPITNITNTEQKNKVETVLEEKIQQNLEEKVLLDKNKPSILNTQTKSLRSKKNKKEKKENGTRSRKTQKQIGSTKKSRQ